MNNMIIAMNPQVELLPLPKENKYDEYFKEESNK